MIIIIIDIIKIRTFRHSKQNNTTQHNLLSKTLLYIKLHSPFPFSFAITSHLHLTSHAPNPNIKQKMAPIERATLFTVGNEEDGKKILETYKTMKSDAKKVC